MISLPRVSLTFALVAVCAALMFTSQLAVGAPHGTRSKPLAKSVKHALGGQASPAGNSTDAAAGSGGASASAAAAAPAAAATTAGASNGTAPILETNNAMTPALSSDWTSKINGAISTLDLVRQELQGVAGQSGQSPPPKQALAFDAGPPALTGQSSKVINVTIGDGFTRFTPAYIRANPGDIVMFNWVGKNNHSVTESDALASCMPSSNPQAFDSGVQQPGTVWNLTIPADAKGLKFFYCKVAKHCSANGMAGTILTPE